MFMCLKTVEIPMRRTNSAAAYSEREMRHCPWEGFPELYCTYIGGLPGESR